MISVDSLTKSYGGRRVVDDVSLECAPGKVTGFLGPNGAGKSTTMRMVAGLTRPDAGTALVGGQAFRDVPNPGHVLGVLLDTRALSAPRTGVENLRLAAGLAGLDVDVETILDRVGLSRPDGRRRVVEYSLGMRQRLGIAQALLCEPQGLMLDEPANGLDPAGIAWMRELLRDFAADGGTVLLSSHLLHEVERTADNLVLIDRGRILRSGTVQDLTASGVVRVAATDMARLRAALRSHGLTGEADGDALLVEAGTAQIGALAHDADLVLTFLAPHAAGGLEDLFLTLTSAEEAA